MKLLVPRSGTVVNYYDNYDYLPEFGGYYNNLTVLQNFKFKLSLNKDYSNEKYGKLIKTLGLSNLENKIANRLSQGQKKRLSIGLIMISDKKLIYLDEPTNGLDPEMLIILKELILEVVNSGTTVIINSHDLNFIADVSTNILILNKGKVVYNGLTENTVIEDTYFKKVGVDSEKKFG